MAGARLALSGITRTYTRGDVRVPVLHGVDLEIAAGERVSIMGRSGSGKSTLLNIIGCLDAPSGGSYLFGDEDVAGFDDDRLSMLRRTSIGFVFQSFHLLPSLTVVENVGLPMEYAHVSPRERHTRAVELLELVGLGHRHDHRPNELSGGERQRVAIARAIVTNPKLLLCDEPTGNLDQRVGSEIQNLFEELNRDLGVTLVIVTHDPSLAKRARRNIKLVDGLVVHDGPALEGF